MLCFNSGNISTSRAALFKLSIGSNAFWDAWIVLPSGSITLFVDGSPVGIIPSCSRPNDEVAPESITAVFLAVLLASFRVHFRLTLLGLGSGGFGGGSGFSMH